MDVIRRAASVRGVRGVLYRAQEGRRRATFAWSELGGLAAVRKPWRRPGVVTAVVVGRNDDYMPDFSERLQATIAWNARHLADEVVFVEWNPPAQRALLSPPLARQFSFLRAYVVDPGIHRETCENPKVPLLEYHAKNVGIRRASGDWVVTTNADAAFAPDLVRRLSQSSWPERVVWTAERVEIPWQEGRKRGLGAEDCLHYRRLVPYDPLGTGEFAMASRSLWHQATGYDESLVKHRIGCDARGVAQMVSLGAITRRAGFVFHLSHPTSCVEAVGEHHGEHAGVDGIPYDNGPLWGLAARRETPLAERVWSIA